VLEQAQEDLFEQAGRFADPHHRQCRRAKTPSGCRASDLRQFAAGFQAFAHVADDALHLRIVADSCKPFSARMIGTPALSRVCICRLKSRRSICWTTLLEQRDVRRVPLALPGPRFLESTGVSPARAEDRPRRPTLSAPSSTPSISLPPALRPCRQSGHALFLELVADAHGFITVVVRPLTHQAHGIAAQGFAGHLLARGLHEFARYLRG
jgi:hypothetical protein